MSFVDEELVSTSNGVSDAELDIAFLQGLASIRPVGIHKHFRMIAVQKSVLDMTGVIIPFPELWSRMQEMYDVEELDNMSTTDAIPFPTSPRSLSPLPTAILNRSPTPTPTSNPLLLRDRRSSRHKTPDIKKSPSLSPIPPTPRTDRTNGNNVDETVTPKGRGRQYQSIGREEPPNHPTNKQQLAKPPRLSGDGQRRRAIPTSIVVNPSASNSLPSGSKSADLINSPFWEKEFGLPIGFRGEIGRGSTLKVELWNEDDGEIDSGWFEEVYERAGVGARGVERFDLDSRVKVEDEDKSLVVDRLVDRLVEIVENDIEEDGGTHIGENRRREKDVSEPQMQQLENNEETMKKAGIKGFVHTRGQKRIKSPSLDDPARPLERKRRHERTNPTTPEEKEDQSESAINASPQKHEPGRPPRRRPIRTSPAIANDIDLNQTTPTCQTSEDELDGLSRRSDSTTRGYSSSRNGRGNVKVGDRERGTTSRSMSSRGRSNSRNGG